MLVQLAVLPLNPQDVERSVCAYTCHRLTAAVPKNHEFLSILKLGWDRSTKAVRGQHFVAHAKTRSSEKIPPREAGELLQSQGDLVSLILAEFRDSEAAYDVAETEHRSCRVIVRRDRDRAQLPAGVLRSISSTSIPLA